MTPSLKNSTPFPPVGSDWVSFGSGVVYRIVEYVRPGYVRVERLGRPGDTYVWHVSSMSNDTMMKWLPGYLIPLEIAEYAERLTNVKMEPFATGGGCDYLSLTVGEGRTRLQALVADPDDFSSPLTLDSPAVVTIYIGGEPDDWGDHGIEIRFPTARRALDFLNSCPLKGFHNG